MKALHSIVLLSLLLLEHTGKDKYPSSRLEWPRSTRPNLQFPDFKTLPFDFACFRFSYLAPSFSTSYLIRRCHGPKISAKIDSDQGGFATASAAASNPLRMDLDLSQMRLRVSPGLHPAMSPLQPPALHTPRPSKESKDLHSGV